MLILAFIIFHHCCSFQLKIKTMKWLLRLDLVLLCVSKEVYKSFLKTWCQNCYCFARLLYNQYTCPIVINYQPRCWRREHEIVKIQEIVNRLFFNSQRIVQGLGSIEATLRNHSALSNNIYKKEQTALMIYFFTGNESLLAAEHA